MQCSVTLRLNKRRYTTPRARQKFFKGHGYVDKYQDHVDRIVMRYVSVLSISVKVDNVARNFDVVVDRSLTMSDHVAAVCRAAYFQLRQLRLITRSLTVDAAKSLVQAFITCRLDYCNSLFSGITSPSFGLCSTVVCSKCGSVRAGATTSHQC